jgi:hypothetical protein
LVSSGFPHWRGRVRRIGISTDAGLARWFKCEVTSTPRIFPADGTNPNPLLILANYCHLPKLSKFEPGVLKKAEQDIGTFS